MRLPSFVLFLLLAAAPVVSMADFVPAPRVDHHQHLQSPAAVELLSSPPPAIELPVDLADLLEGHAAHWNEAQSLTALYAQDSFVTTNIDAGVHGAAEVVAKYAST